MRAERTNNAQFLAPFERESRRGRKKFVENEAGIKNKLESIYPKIDRASFIENQRRDIHASMN